MRRFITIGLLISFLVACSTRKVGVFVKSYSPAIHKANFSFSDGVAGRYYHRSFAKNNKPVVMFIIGGSGHFSSIYTLAGFSTALKKINAEVFILQKRYVKNREAEMRNARKAFINDYYFDRMVADQEYFIRMVLNKEENRNRKIVLLGVSEGVTIAAKVAADIPEINYLALIGGGGLKQGEELKILYPDQKENLELLYADIKKHPDSVDSMTIGYSYRYWSGILFEDPMKYLLHLGIPVIIGNGEKDKSTPIESARYLKRKFDELHKTNLIYIEYAGCDHSLREPDGKSHLPDFISSLDSLINTKTN